jgi:hypothetical protein
VKPIPMTVVESTEIEGALSLRMNDDGTGGEEIFRVLLTASGGKPGDVVELRDPPPRFCPHCGSSLEGTS